MTRIFIDSSVSFSAAYSSRGHSRDLILMALGESEGSENINDNYGVSLFATIIQCCTVNFHHRIFIGRQDNGSELSGAGHYPKID